MGFGAALLTHAAIYVMLVVVIIRCSGTAVLFESVLGPRCTNKNVSTKWQEDQEEISENNNDSNHTQQHQTPKLYNTSSKILVVKSVHSLATDLFFEGK